MSEERKMTCPECKGGGWQIDPDDNEFYSTAVSDHSEADCPTPDAHINGLRGDWGTAEADSHKLEKQYHKIPCARCNGAGTVVPPEFLLAKLIRLQEDTLAMLTTQRDLMVSTEVSREKVLSESQDLMGSLRSRFEVKQTFAEGLDPDKVGEEFVRTGLRPETVELLKDIDKKMRAPVLANTADRPEKPPVGLAELKTASAIRYECSEDDLSIVFRRHGEGTKSPQYVLEVSQRGSIQWESPVPKTRKSVLLEEYRQDLLKDLEERRELINNALEMVTR